MSDSSNAFLINDRIRLYELYPVANAPRQNPKPTRPVKSARKSSSNGRGRRYKGRASKPAAKTARGPRTRPKGSDYDEGFVGHHELLQRNTQSRQAISQTRPMMLLQGQTSQLVPEMSLTDSVRIPKTPRGDQKRCLPPVQVRVSTHVEELNRVIGQRTAELQEQYVMKRDKAVREVEAEVDAILWHRKAELKKVIITNQKKFLLLEEQFAHLRDVKAEVQRLKHEVTHLEAEREFAEDTFDHAVMEEERDRKMGMTVRPEGGIEGVNFAETETNLLKAIKTKLHEQKTLQAQLTKLSEAATMQDQNGVEAQVAADQALEYDRQQSLNDMLKEEEITFATERQRVSEALDLALQAKRVIDVENEQSRHNAADLGMHLSSSIDGLLDAKVDLLQAQQEYNEVYAATLEKAILTTNALNTASRKVREAAETGQASLASVTQVLSSLQSNLMCTRCMSRLVLPVLFSPCGHSFCRSCCNFPDTMSIKARPECPECALEYKVHKEEAGSSSNSRRMSHRPREMYPNPLLQPPSTFATAATGSSSLSETKKFSGFKHASNARLQNLLERFPTFENENAKLCATFGKHDYIWPNLSHERIQVALRTAAQALSDVRLAKFKELAAANASTMPALTPEEGEEEEQEADMKQLERKENVLEEYVALNPSSDIREFDKLWEQVSAGKMFFHVAEEITRSIKLEKIAKESMESDTVPSLPSTFHAQQAPTLDLDILSSEAHAAQIKPFTLSPRSVERRLRLQQEKLSLQTRLNVIMKKQSSDEDGKSDEHNEINTLQGRIDDLSNQLLAEQDVERRRRKAHDKRMRKLANPTRISSSDSSSSDDEHSNEEIKQHTPVKVDVKDIFAFG